MDLSEEDDLPFLDNIEREERERMRHVLAHDPFDDFFIYEETDEDVLILREELGREKKKKK